MGFSRISAFKVLDHSWWSVDLNLELIAFSMPLESVHAAKADLVHVHAHWCISNTVCIYVLCLAAIAATQKYRGKFLAKSKKTMVKKTKCYFEKKNWWHQGKSSDILEIWSGWSRKSATGGWRVCYMLDEIQTESLSSQLNPNAEKDFSDCQGLLEHSFT